MSQTKLPFTRGPMSTPDYGYQVTQRLIDADGRIISLTWQAALWRWLALVFMLSSAILAMTVIILIYYPRP